ncbi:hypothetical protein LINPERHAP2_LOCUS16051 [Linum perenne]
MRSTLSLPSTTPISSHYFPKTHAVTLPPRPHRLRQTDRKVALPRFTSYNNSLAAGRSSQNRVLLHLVAAVAPTSQPIEEEATADVPSGADIVRGFYEGINDRDLKAVEELIAHNCVYEDLIFPRPFVGRKAILEFFNKFIDSISGDLKFAIDDISAQDSSAVGVTWHLEWKEKPFPFSKGCSFYRLEVINGKRQIIYGRDSVEPALKPGEAALVNCYKGCYLVTATVSAASRPASAMSIHSVPSFNRMYR